MLEVQLLLLDLQQYDGQSAGTHSAFEAYMKSIWGESYCIVGASGPDKQAQPVTQPAPPSAGAVRPSTIAVSEDLRRAERDRLEFLKLLQVPDNT